LLINEDPFQRDQEVNSNPNLKIVEGAVDQFVDAVEVIGVEPEEGIALYIRFSKIIVLLSLSVLIFRCNDIERAVM
jgi:hypothetical protein